MHHHAAGIFEVVDFQPVEAPPLAVETPMPSGVATIEKRFTGDLDGRSLAWFVGAQTTDGAGTYAAVETFTGRLGGAAGSFVFMHTASTHGTDRYGELLVIADGSGTEDLAGISGAGRLTIDADGTHRMAFDYDLGSDQAPV